MNCGLYWNRAFIDFHASPSWCNGPLKKHREHVLLDRAKSMLPATRPLVEAEALINQECMACPLCGMGIVRVSGCDHMWCTSCETGFSYTTRQRIPDRANANPHRNTRMRQLREQARGSAEAPHPPDGGECGGEIIDWPDVHRCHTNSCGGNRVTITFLMAVHHCARHVVMIVLRDLPTNMADTSELRVRYSLGDFGERRFGALLQQQEKFRERLLEIRATLEVFTLIVFNFFSDMKRRLSEGLYADCKERCSMLATSIEKLVNAPLQNLADLYGTTTPRIITNPSKRLRVGTSGYDMYDADGHCPRTTKERLIRKSKKKATGMAPSSGATEPW
jgi:hypothetical protein